VRRALTETQAGRATGPRSLMATLRDHGGGAPRWSPINGTLHAPCVHAGGWLASSQTTASMVSDLRGDPLHWVSATSAPCTSIFKPARVDEPVDLGPAPTDRFDPATLWWRHELLHRAVLADYPRHIQLLQTQRDAVEAEWVASPPSTTEAFALAARLEQTWLEQIDGPLVDRRPWWVRSTWRDLDKCANMPVTP
jgi:secernin